MTLPLRSTQAEQDSLAPSEVAGLNPRALLDVNDPQ
jgi:hypothetical protein